MGFKPTLEPIDPDEIGNVALYLRHSFLFYRSTIAEREVVFAEPIGDIDLNPGRVQHYFQVLSRALGAQMVLVLDTLETYNRQRFAERRIAFIVPGQQLYIPMLLVDLQTTTPNKYTMRDYFRPSTQAMLLHHLWIQSLNGMDQRSIAPIIQYSEMTVSRAVKEFERAGVVTKDKYGIHFLEDRKALWEKVVDKLTSPIKETVYANEVINPSSAFVKSGLNALAHYTQLVGQQTEIYAIASEIYNHVREKHLPHVSHKAGNVEIQLWTYGPHTLTKDGYVDPFSLYLSLREENTDERVSMAFDELFDKFL